MGCVSYFFGDLAVCSVNNYSVVLAYTYVAHLEGYGVVSLHSWWNCKVLQGFDSTAHLVGASHSKQVKSVIVSSGSLGLWYASFVQILHNSFLLQTYFYQGFVSLDEWGWNFCSFILKGT